MDIKATDKTILCNVCDGDSFHIYLIDGKNKFECANPICKEFLTFPKNAEESCSYCGSGIILDDTCQVCGL